MLFWSFLQQTPRISFNNHNITFLTCFFKCFDSFQLGSQQRWALIYNNWKYSSSFFDELGSQIMNKLIIFLPDLNIHLVYLLLCCCSVCICIGLWNWMHREIKLWALFIFYHFGNIIVALIWIYFTNSSSILVNWVACFTAPFLKTASSKPSTLLLKGLYWVIFCLPSRPFVMNFFSSLTSSYSSSLD